MRQLYLVIGWAIVLLGMTHMFATTRLFDGVTQSALWFFSAGIAMSLNGALNLLNRSYGAEAPGLRMVCLGANLVMTCFAAVAGVVSDPTVIELVLVVGLHVFATMLSILAVLMPPEVEPQERSETQPRVTWPGFGSRVRHPLSQKPRERKP
ncbi:MAG TPA: hypothetical protein VM557_11360 [Thermoanaerobaculia bacterium]|nr:hypothetical protein [Thermoanaerobaculia bacterium]